MQYKKINEGYGYALVLEKGEAIKDKLIEFARAEKIQSAYFAAIGAVDNVRLGYYNLTDKKYFFREYLEMYEVCSLSGNIVLHEGQPMAHMHAVLREPDGTVQAGHLDDAKVEVTLEVFLHLLSGANIERKLDQESGLPLWNIKE